MPAKERGAVSGYGRWDSSLIDMTASMVDSFAAINAHWMTMAQASLRHNLHAADELRQCQSPGEVVETQMKLAQKAYEDYVEETKKFSEIVAKMQTDAISYLSTDR